MIPDLDEVLGHIKASITKPSKRDQQVKLGASEIGDDCLFCVGYKLARRFFDLPSRGSGFGYAAWVGTMCHEWLENHLEQPTPTLREYKVPVFELDGYGMIYGTADIVWPEWKRVGDWKWPGEYTYDKLRLRRAKDPTGWRPSNQYRYQQQALAFGLNNSGIEIEWTSIFFLPRHTNSIDSVIPFEEPYTEEMAYLAKARLEAIIEDVLEGRLGDLPSDPDCFECSSFQGSGRPDVTGYMAKRINHEPQKTGANK